MEAKKGIVEIAHAMIRLDPGNSYSRTLRLLSLIRGRQRPLDSGHLAGAKRRRHTKATGLTIDYG